SATSSRSTAGRSAAASRGRSAEDCTSSTEPASARKAPSSSEETQSMLKIAGVQFSGHTKRERNLEKITRYVTEAARNGARVVCLPELGTSIYFCWESNYSHFDYAESVPGPSTEEVSS